MFHWWCSSSYRWLTESAVMLLFSFMNGPIWGEINQCERWQLVNTFPRPFHCDVLSTSSTVPWDAAREYEETARVWRGLNEAGWPHREQQRHWSQWRKKSGLLQLLFESPYITSLWIRSVYSALKLNHGPFHPHVAPIVLRGNTAALWTEKSFSWRSLWARSKNGSWFNIWYLTLYSDLLFSTIRCELGNDIIITSLLITCEYINKEPSEQPLMHFDSSSCANFVREQIITFSLKPNNELCRWPCYCPCKKVC